MLVAYSPDASAREALIDFLTDSLHLFGEEQVRFALDSALIHHEAEQNEVLASYLRTPNQRKETHNGKQSSHNTRQ